MIFAARPATSPESMRRGRSSGTGNSSTTFAGAAGQQHDPVAEAYGLAHVVGHEQDREGPRRPDPLQLVVEQVAGHRVERAERLVHQQDVAVLGERPGDGDALAHAAGQLVRPLLAEPAEVHRLQQLGGPRPALGLGDPPRTQRQLDVAAHGQPGEERGLLEHQPDPRAIHVDRAERRPVQPGDDRQQRALAAPRGARGCRRTPHRPRSATPGPGRGARPRPVPYALETSLSRTAGAVVLSGSRVMTLMSHSPLVPPWPSGPRSAARGRRCPSDRHGRAGPPARRAVRWR